MYMSRQVAMSLKIGNLSSIDANKNKSNGEAANTSETEMMAQIRPDCIMGGCLENLFRVIVNPCQCWLANDVHVSLCNSL